MSHGVKGGSATSGRVSIPGNVKKTIENIKEITGQNHSEYEIYVMLKECCMDPNETVQRLLLTDTFHEVKGKRDRRKENLNKETAESKWKQGTQVQANRVGHGNYSSRNISHDAGGGRNSATLKENATTLPLEKSTGKAPLAIGHEMKKNITSLVASTVAPVSNGPSGATSQNSNIIYDNHVFANGDVNQLNATGNSRMSKFEGPLPHSSPVHSITNNATSVPSAPASGSYFSSSDTILFPSQDLPLHSAVGTIRHVVGSQRTPVILIADNPTASRSTSNGIPSYEVDSSNLQQKTPNDLQGAGKNQNLETMLPASSTIGIHPDLQPTAVVEQDTLELQRKLENSHISNNQHVIIPDHLHAPEAEKLGFCFGSFDTSFELHNNHNSCPESHKNQPFSESEAFDKPVKELISSNENTLVHAEREISEQPQSPSQGPENFEPSEVEVSPSIPPDYSDPKQEVASGMHQHDVFHTSSKYNFAYMPPVPSGQPTPVETLESQVREAPQFPGYFVHQSFDPSTYYAQIYSSGVENGGRVSPFHYAAANTYNENGVIVSPQTSQSPQESSITSQQHLPIFNQPTGLHLPHYPPNYFPYGPYFTPFYAPPHAFHQFIINGAVPQQPQAGNLYPTPPEMITTKYSVAQSKASNTGNPTHVGLPGGYSLYGLPMAHYISGPGTATVTSTPNVNLAASYVKENHIYASAQQSEGTGVWFPAPSRDISTLQQASSFFNIPQQGHQLAFTQPGHGNLTGVFHPAHAQAPTVHHPLLQQSQSIITSPADMTIHTPSVYQQPQHAQPNWPINN